MRVVRTPEGTIVLDPGGRAPGRGAYLCAQADCWSAAEKRRALEHALKAPLPEDLAAMLAAGPDGRGSITQKTTAGAPADPDASATAPRADTVEGGTHGQE